MDFSESRKEYLRELIANNKPFTITDDGGISWLDIMVPDASSNFALKFLAKFNLTPFNMAAPTFGDIGNPVGLVMVTIPYDKIVNIIEMQISDNMMEKFRTEQPKAYEFWSNANKVEGAIPTIATYGKTQKQIAWEQAHAAELAAKNRKSAIPTGVIEGTQF